MKGKTKKKSLRVAGVLLSMCMLGGTVPPARAHSF